MNSSENYRNCEWIIHGLNTAVMKFSVESIVESVVSIFERKFPAGRTSSEKTMYEEMNITLNGPSLPNADNLLGKSVAHYFKDHTRREGFIRKNNFAPLTKESDTVRRLKNEVSKFPFMD